jgi:hypothetical protein
MFEIDEFSASIYFTFTAEPPTLFFSFAYSLPALSSSALRALCMGGRTSID